MSSCARLPKVALGTLPLTVACATPSTSESSRLPAIIKNESFAQSPFATIRQHTLNTLAMQKNPPIQRQPGKKGK